MTRWINNEVANKVTYAGTESSPGVAAAPTHVWPGELSITKTQDLRDTSEATGGYDDQVEPSLGLPSFAGTYAEELRFQSLPVHMQYGLVEGAAGVLVPGATGAYERDQSPAFNLDNEASATLQYGINGQAWQSRGVRHNEWTITIDTDDADGVWKFSSNLFVISKEPLPGLFDGVATGGTANTLVQTSAGRTVDQDKGKFLFKDFGTHTGEVRKIIGNTADTWTVDEPWETPPTAGTVFRVEANLPVLPVSSWTKIPSYGTRYFIDPYGEPLGVTQILDRVISFNLTKQSNRTGKRFAEHGVNEMSRKTGRGKRVVTGQLRAELDRRDEYDAWELLNRWGLRVEQLGPVIDESTGTRMVARIDIPKGAFSTPNEDARENNMTATFPFRTYLPESEPRITVHTVTDLATLP